MLNKRATFQHARVVGKARDRVLRLRWTDNTYDDYRTVLYVDGWDFSRFSKNSPFQYCHDWFAPPIGRVLDPKIEVEVERMMRSGSMIKDKALDCDVRFSHSRNHEFSHLIYDLYIEGTMRATSCGFDPIDRRKATEEDGERFNIPVDDIESGKAQVYWANKLFEISAVPLPGNENAVKGLENVMAKRGSSFARKVGTGWLNQHFHKSRMSGLLLPEYFGGTLNAIQRQLNGEGPIDWRQAKSQVQSVIFSKENWDVDSARKWLDERDFKSDKVDEEENTIRFRQFDPGQCVEDSGVVLTEDLPEGISMFACDVAQEGACPAEAKIDAKRLLELDPELLAGIRIQRVRSVRTRFRQAGQLASLLNTLVDDRVTEDRPREQIIEEMATEAGIEVEAVTQILSGDIGCPPVERFEAFAKVLDASVESMIAAGNEDGCEYNGNGDGEGEGEGEVPEVVPEPGTTSARRRRYIGRARRTFDEQITKLRAIEKATGEVAAFFEEMLAQQGGEPEPPTEGEGEGESEHKTKKYIDAKFAELRRMIQANGGAGTGQAHTPGEYLDDLVLDNITGERELGAAVGDLAANLGLDIDP